MKEDVRAELALHDALCNFVNRVRLHVHVEGYANTLTEEWTRIIKEEKDDPEKIRRKREEATRLFQKIKEETEKASEKLLEDEAPEHLKKVLSTAQTRNVLAMKKIIELTNHCDKNLWRDVLKGFQTVGEYEKTGLWKENPSEEKPKELEGFYAAAVKVRDAAPKGFPVDALQEIINNIEEDVKLGDTPR